VTARAVPAADVLGSPVRNWLYARPELYEAVYHGSDHEVPRMCDELFRCHLGGAPSSLLDVGCGTGRDLEWFAATVPDCIGIDAQEQMVGFARSRRPTIDFRVGDMTSLALGRTFDVITCLGLAFTYLHTNDAVSRALQSLAAHSQRGTLLVMEVINSIADPAGRQRPTEFVIDSNGTRARATATYSADLRRQLLVRRRTWCSDGREVHDDFVEFRMFFPLELEHHLSSHGFRTLGMYDNTDLQDSDLAGPNLFVVASYAGRGPR
jgi:SAM-dependent methyltransferase